MAGVSFLGALVPEAGRAAPASEDDGLRLRLGVEWRSAESEYHPDRRSSAFPLIHLSGERYYWRTTSLGHYLLGASDEHGYRTLAIELVLPPDGVIVEQEVHLAGLADREPTLEGGFRVEGGGRWGVAEIGASTDLEGEHGGTRVHLRYERPIRLGSLVIAPALFATWRDRRNADHYFGVDEGETSVGRPRYDVTGATLDAGLGYSVTYSFGPDLDVFHTLEVRGLDAPIDASPLTTNGSPVAASAGVLYRVL